MFSCSRNMVLFMTLLCAVIGISTAINMGPINSSAIVGKLSEKYYPLTKEDLEVANDVTVILDEFRPQMAIGVYAVPPMDPYHRASLKPIVFDGPIGTVNLYNLTLTGLKEYTLELIETRLKTSRWDFNISVPSVLAEVDCKGNFFEDKLFLNDSVHIRILLNNVHVISASTVEPIVKSDGKHYVLVGLGLDIYAEKCDVDINSGQTAVVVKPTELTQDFIDVVTFSIAENVMEQVKEIQFLLPD